MLLITIIASINNGEWLYHAHPILLSDANIDPRNQSVLSRTGRTAMGWKNSVRWRRFSDSVLHRILQQSQSRLAEIMILSPSQWSFVKIIASAHYSTQSDDGWTCHGWFSVWCQGWFSVWSFMDSNPCWAPSTASGRLKVPMNDIPRQKVRYASWGSTMVCGSGRPAEQKTIFDGKAPASSS